MGSIEACLHFVPPACFDSWLFAGVQCGVQCSWRTVQGNCEEKQDAYNFCDFSYFIQILFSAREYWGLSYVSYSSSLRGFNKSGSVKRELRPWRTANLKRKKTKSRGRRWRRLLYSLTRGWTGLAIAPSGRHRDLLHMAGFTQLSHQLRHLYIFCWCQTASWSPKHWLFPTFRFRRLQPALSWLHLLHTQQ